MPTAVWKHEQNHSDLEVDGRKHFSDPEAIKIGYSDLEALPGPGTLEGMQSDNLQAYHPDVSGKDAHGAIPYHPAASGNRDAEGAIPYYGENEKQAGQIASDQQKSKRRICGLASRTFWILVTIGVLLVIAAVVGGAVGGTQASKSSTDTTKPTNGTAAASNAGIRPDSNLAAIAWTVTPTRYQYRVYYQDSDNSIKESAYDSSLGTWKVSKIVDGTGVTSGTSIAASASKQAANGTDAVVSFQVKSFDSMTHNQRTSTCISSMQTSTSPSFQLRKESGTRPQATAPDRMIARMRSLPRITWSAVSVQTLLWLHTH